MQSAAKSQTQQKRLTEVKVKVTQSCLSDPMDCSPPGSSVRGILQARILEWVSMPSFRGYSPPRDFPTSRKPSLVAPALI